MSINDFTDDEILERAEAVASTGDKRATSLLRLMIQDRLKTGEIHFFDRLAAYPYLFGDRHRAQ